MLNVRELMAQLATVDPSLPVEVATCDRKDEWYELVDVEVTTNGNERDVVVLNTD